MITSARATPSPATSGISRSSASRTRSGSRSLSAKSLAARADRRREPLGVLVLQGHRQAAQRAPGRDIAAHRARADDMHVRIASNSPSLPKRLQPLLQLEHADQVRARSAIAADARSTPDRTAARASAIAVVLDPDIEDRVRRRIVLAACARSRPACAPAPR